MKTDLEKSKTIPKTALGACPGGSLGHLGTPWGQELQKHQKNHFSGPSFWTTFATHVGTFAGLFFACFLNLSLYICFVPMASTGLDFEDFWVLFWTPSASKMQKWKPCSRHGESFKMEVWRDCVFIFFVSFAQSLFGRRFFKVCYAALSYLTHLCIPLGSIFDTIARLFRQRFSDQFWMKDFFWKRNLAEGICDPS